MEHTDSTGTYWVDRNNWRQIVSQLSRFYAIWLLLIVEIIDNQPLQYTPLAWVEKELQMQLGHYSGWFPSRFHNSHFHFGEAWVFPWTQISHHVVHGNYQLWPILLCIISQLEILIIECIEKSCRGFPACRLVENWITTRVCSFILSSLRI